MTESVPIACIAKPPDAFIIRSLLMPVNGIKKKKHGAGERERKRNAKSTTAEKMY